jgi:RNA polymerase sigma factor (TIGR02999 family)
MTSVDSVDFESLLREWQTGNHDAGSRLIELVYLDLRRMARKSFQGGLADHTLQPTALANETCMRLLRFDPSRLNGKSHFYAIAAIQMKNILIDHLRRRPVDKRSGERIAIDEIELADDSRTVELLELEIAMSRLKEINLRAYNIVRLRYIVGLSEADTAEALGVCPSTLKRDWRFAKGLLADYLGGSTRRINIGSPRRYRKVA